MKYISKEEFFNQLNSCEYGRQYIELVTNPKNHIGKKEEGEDHHMYMKAICGENSHLIRLSYFNHIKAHIILAEAGIQGNFWWQHKAKTALTQFTRKQWDKLSDIEKITFEEIYHWSELLKNGHKAAGIIQSINWKNKPEEEKRAKVNKFKNTINNRTEERRNEISDNCRNGQLKRFSENPEAREMCRQGSINAWKNKSDEEKQQYSEKMSNVMLNTWENNKEEILNKRFNTLAQRTSEEIEATHQKYVDAQSRIWDNKTEDEMKAWSDKIAEAWANKPEEEKQQFSDDISVRMTAYWASVSEDRKSEIGEKISKSHKERWANLSEEEKQEYIRKMTEINRNTIANRTEEKRQEICQIQKEINSRPEVKAKKSAGQVGRKVINNGIEEKRVYPNEIEYYLNLGWKIGQKCSHVKKSA